MNLYREGSRYLKKTIRKGSHYVKLIKFVRLIKHTLYYILQKKIGEYPSPPSGLNHIGYFDKGSLIHTPLQFRAYFDSANLYEGGDFKPMKTGHVSLAEYNQKIMVKKVYRGFQKHNRFYNELICLNELRSVKGIPNILYADYTNSTLFIEYLDGISLSVSRIKNGIIINEKNKDFYYSGFFELLSAVHDRNVIMYDLRHANMMVTGSTFCLLDFADSIYGIDEKIWKSDQLKSGEIEKLKNEINRICSLQKKSDAVYIE